MSRGRRAVLAVLPAVVVPAVVALSMRAGGRTLLPILATAAVYPVMAAFVLERRAAAAAGAVLLWAASLSLAVIAAAALDPDAAGAAVLGGPRYRDEMFAYVRAGDGRETDPSRFVPQHLLHLAAFAALTFVTGGLLGILLGAVLVGYMSYYVGCLAAGGEAARALLLGWPPWAILRVVAFIMLGVALSRPLLVRLAPRWRAGGTAGPRFWPGPAWYWTALGLLAGDVVLKTVLAPAWAVLLRPCLAGP